MEDGRSSGAGAALELCLNGPWHRGAAVALEHRVNALGVFILGIEEEAIHVEETCSDRREPRLKLDSAVGGINIASVLTL